MDTSRTTLGSPGALKWLHTRSVGVTFRIYRAEYQQSRTYIVQAHRALSLPRPGPSAAHHRPRIIAVCGSSRVLSRHLRSVHARRARCGIERRIATRYRHSS